MKYFILLITILSTTTSYADQWVTKSHCSSTYDDQVSKCDATLGSNEDELKARACKFKAETSYEKCLDVVSEQQAKADNSSGNN